jgi:hypothetical protein
MDKTTLDVILGGVAVLLLVVYMMRRGKRKKAEADQDEF